MTSEKNPGGEIRQVGWVLPVSRRFFHFDVIFFDPNPCIADGFLQNYTGGIDVSSQN